MDGRLCDRLTAWALAGLVLGTCGCASHWQRRELQAVARDWCQVIRASQVLPVYPLTEDLQPGDVFLVTRPIGQEARLYAGRGFLPFEQHLKRLQPLDFASFYGRTNDISQPENWLRAAFPTYRFRVKSGAGLKLALPVQGVPLGLNWLQSGSAIGSVTIAEASTYGVSLAELSGELETWSNHPDRLALFRVLRANARRPIYLRVVSRVYLAGSLVVSLQSEQAVGGAVRGGPSPEVALLEPGNADAATNYLGILDLLNQKVGKALLGGSVRFAQASGRAVTLKEAFARPLVVGYLAFDFPILEDGSLGAPVSTLERLKTKAQPEVRLGELTAEQIDYGLLVCAIQSKPPELQAKIYDAAAEALSGRFAQDYWAAKQAGWTPELAYSQARRSLMKQRPDGEARVHGALRAAWIKHLGTP